MRSLFFALLLLIATAAHAQTARPCRSLQEMRIEDANLLSAVEVPATSELPAYCRVLGFVRPSANFEIRLPIRDWNGKFYMVGCGGFCGSMMSDAPGFTNAMNFGLKRNYAAVTTDSGHWGRGPVDARWARYNTVARLDWGQRAVTETARVAKEIVRTYYRANIKKSYFAGCSTGGRMAAMEAERYPDDFDGIISGAPALDYTGLVATFFAWITQANLDSNGKPIMTAAKARLVENAVIGACANKQGIKDNLVEDPRQCDFKPSSLLCKDGNTTDCLSKPEVATLEKWYHGPVDAEGRQLYPGGIPLGSEANWTNWLFGEGNAPAILPLFGDDFIRDMAFDPATQSIPDARSYNFDTDPSRLAAAAGMYNAATWIPGKPGKVAGADISAFRKKGGKMILYHGWGDPLVTPYLTVAYYDALAKEAGGPDEARNFVRLFMIPGMDHCGINTKGPGISDTGIDPLTALEQWVEHGNAPDRMIALKSGQDGKVLWKRPICAYPQVTKRVGKSITDPASYQCMTP
ncbi:tannase/feruloyl esterase family alpha/beta hydrolase [Burkholderia stagnalis]